MAMELSEALGLDGRGVVAFVGAGGKTSLMLTLARELQIKEVPLALTTTTKVRKDEIPRSVEVIFTNDVKDIEELKGECSRVLPSGKLPFFASKENDGGDKLLGIGEDLVNDISSMVDFLLVEADGARHRSFKVPRQHEPVIPESTTHMVVVMGLDAMFQPLDGGSCFNVDGIVKGGRYDPKDILDDNVVRDLLFREDGYLRFKTLSRRTIIALNKADTQRDVQKARDLASALSHGSVNQIFMTSTLGTPVVKEVRSNANDRICGMVLAAGEGRGFGEAKQLAQLGGMSLIKRVVGESVKSQCEQIVVVLGHAFEDVRVELSQFEGSGKVRVVFNPDYKSGMSSSLKKAVSSISNECNAAMFILGDMPLISSEIMDRLVRSYRDSCAAICVPVVHGKRGNPVIIRRELFPMIMKLTGDIGARGMIDANPMITLRVEMEGCETQFDIDTKDDLIRFSRRESDG